MQVATPSSNSWLGKLRNQVEHVFPRLLNTSSVAFTQNLLNEEEIRELRSRVLSHKQQPLTQHRDTASQHMGDNRSTHRGYGMDYEESRTYQAGDDPRSLNWALSARTGELYTKVFREERRPGVFIVIDRRNSMRFGTRVRLKVTQALRVATCIAFAAEQRHASIGGAILNAENTKIDWHKESSHKQTGLALIHAANTPCPPIHAGAASTSAEYCFSDVLSSLQASLPAGTQLYIISDFIDIDETLRGQLLHLTADHSLHAIHISDPAEHTLPKIGNGQFETAIDAPARSLDTGSVELQKQYAVLAEKHFTDRKQLFRNLGIRYTAISTTDNEIETLLDNR